MRRESAGPILKTSLPRTLSLSLTMLRKLSQKHPRLSKSWYVVSNA